MLSDKDLDQLESFYEGWQEPRGDGEGGYKEYNYVSSNGRRYKGLQGCERFYIDSQEYRDENIVHGRDMVPVIKYIFEGKEHSYYPDFYVPHERMLVEVKSRYTLKAELERNKAKMNACKQMGYRFEFRVYNKDGSRGRARSMHGVEI